LNYGYDILDPPDLRDLEGIRTAYEAALVSDHPRTQVGAVLGNHWGSNTKADYRDKYPDNVEFSRVHAETSVILRAAEKWGTTTRAHTMYAPWACCTNCAANIIMSAIPRVVVHHQRMQLTPPKWQEEVYEGVQMLIRNNIRVEAVSKKFGVRLRVNGEEVEL
jgi:deoxycytidylate deaminase